MAGPTSAKSSTEKQTNSAARTSPGPGQQPTFASPQANIMALQDAAGNQAVNHLLDSDPVDPQLAANGQAVFHPGQIDRGRALDPATRSSMEASFRRDFSDVQVHTGPFAEQTTDRFKAYAVTQGNRIYFAPDAYHPHTPEGRAILAHELTHVVQNRQAGNSVPAAESSIEAEASLTSLQVMAGQPAQVQLAASGARPLALSRKAKIALGVGLGILGGLALGGGILGILHVAGVALSSSAVGGTLAALGLVGGIFGGLIGRSRTKKKERAVTDPQEIAKEAVEALNLLTRRVDRLIDLAAEASETKKEATPDKAYKTLNQSAVQLLIGRAQEIYTAPLNRLPPDDPLRKRLRSAYLETLEKLRVAADTALELSAELDESSQAKEKKQYAETLTLWIEASPMTSAGLAGTTEFDEADAETGQAYESMLEAYLDDLIEQLPSLDLSQDEKNKIYERLLIALRRAYVTIEAGPTGKVDVRSITNERIAKKYQQVVGLLTGGITNAQQMSVITASVHEYELPEEIDETSLRQQLESSAKIGKVDMSHVPADEIPYVLYGLVEVSRISFLPPSTIKLQNAYWPVTFLVRRGEGVIGVRYELVFDNEGNVRVERLGEAKAREVPPDFSALSIAEKKQRLIAEFGLAAIVGRPKHGDRPERVWEGWQLDQVKAAFDLLPPGEITALKGYTLVRDYQTTDKDDASQRLAGLAHTQESPNYDEPGPPTHGPPHIHYYDLAFEQNKGGAVGPPGAAGPGGDQVLLHEVGHARIQQAHLAARQAILAANQKLQIPAEIQGVTLYSKKQVNAWKAWNQAQKDAGQAISAYNKALTSDPPAGKERQEELLEAAQAAIKKRNKARLALSKAGFSKKTREKLLRGTAKYHAAMDAVLAGQQQMASAQAQIPTFVALAKRFGFHKFTDYALTDPDDGEWFAETYALFVTDPDRLHRMNRKMYLWFQAGMPMDPDWSPPEP